MPLIEYYDVSAGFGVGPVNGSYTDMWPNYLSKAPHIKRYLANAK